MVGNKVSIPINLVSGRIISDLDENGILFPTTKWGSTFLILKGEETLAVFMSEDHKYRFFPCKDNKSWSGLFLKGIEIRVDIESSYDLDHYSPTPGSIVLNSNGINLSLINSERFYGSGVHLQPLKDFGEIPPSSSGVAIPKWEIGITVQSEWIPILKIDLAKPE